jgi:phosphoribosylanthranilate isomerase
MKVKICGLKSVDAALQAAEEGADALGFVFAQSKRQITAEKAREIINELPDDVWKVGVFVNESPEMVKEIADKAGLTHIQLHGEEVPADYKEIGRPIIKSLSVRTDADIKKLQSISADFILLDSPPGLYQGGNGTRFNWELAASIENNDRIILAGGLTPDNVKTAIDTVRPFMVDVSSGVESDGEKDLNKIRSFIEAAKGY